MDPLPSISTVLQRPANEFVNDSEVEGLWMIKAVEHMQIYFNLISAISPKLLKLTSKDDVIYSEFRKAFPDFNVANFTVDDLKSEEAKNKWRPFCNMFEGEVEDFNFATMIRLDSSKDYSEENSMVVPRIQFLAIEIARNREGFNDEIREKFPPPAKGEKVVQES